MHYYRIYAFREDGHFSTVRRLECTDRDQAVQKARQILDGPGRVNTLSHDIPTFGKKARLANCARSNNSDIACDERQRDAQMIGRWSPTSEVRSFFRLRLS